MTHRKATLWLVAALVLVGPVTFGSPSREAPAPPGARTPEAGFPLAVTDDGGSSFTIPDKPVRIASLTLFTDEVLLDLVGPGRLAAVSIFGPDPDISNVAAEAVKVPASLRLAVEPILGLHPDLVLVADWSDAATVKQLRDAGLPVYVCATAHTVPEIRQTILSLAQIVGERDKGQAMVDAMDARLAEVSRRVSAVPQAQRPRVVDYATWGAAMGKGSSWDEIVRAAGLRNAVGDLEADTYGQVPLSKEKLVELDPDLLILPGWVYGDPKGAETFAAQVRQDPALAGLKALRTGRTYQMPERLKAAVSQYVADAVEYLAKAAYPELFH